LIKNVAFTALGFIFLGLGAIGIALPVMPTTPFVLLAALCFSTGNNRIAGWLRRNRIFGPYIENIKTRKSVPAKLIAGSIIFVWTGLIISMSIMQTLRINVLLIVVGLGVTIHLLKIGMRKADRCENKNMCESENKNMCKSENNNKHIGKYKNGHELEHGYEHIHGHKNKH